MSSDPSPNPDGTPAPPEESGRYDDDDAALYDTEFDDVQDAPDAVDFLAALAGDGPALELGIGAGRVALPLLRRGISVHGIDNSEAMLARLRSKPDGARVQAM
ncbi:MAG: class I SAM-dependent methyltransferase, partial [Candidatus Dormibacteria bacterium]